MKGEESKSTNAYPHVGLEYKSSPRVRHFARVLFEEVGEEKIKAHFQKDLSDLKIASHYGCHYLKPSEVHDHFDDVEDPNSLDTLVALTGAEVVDYSVKNKCCGGLCFLWMKTWPCL